jgi:restriction endonuclease Mrr
MLPLLNFAIDGNEYSSKEAVNYLGKDFKLTDEKKKPIISHKEVSIFYDRTHWALTYPKHATLLESTKEDFLE